MRWLFPLVACVVAAAATEYLLPGDVVPRHYDVKYTFDVDPNTNFSFYGVVDILFNVKRTTDKIVLHAKDFTVAENLISFSGPQNLRSMGVKLNDTYNLMTISLDRMMNEDDNYTMTLPFYGNLKQGLDGAYISTYVNMQTKTKEYLIATQFEAISARKGFPCFDEPMYKATFTLTIGHHKEYTAISNMPLLSSSSENAIEDYFPWAKIIEQAYKKELSDFVWDTYEKSVPMSTYLVAFVVSKFSYRESPAELSNTKFRIWARTDALDQTAYASKTGPKALSYFEQWFNVSYPLPKQDMIAIPDFAAGAMENWGLITYRETELLYDENKSSFLNKERVAEVIAHELAHQWFGNLVTMKWWSDLWLNEGFATFAASVAVSKVEPTWHADRNYAVDNMLSILNLDALESSHPVSVPIDDPKRISEIFDEISYRKGSTLIRMMTMFLGDDIFRKAINRYLLKYSYNNAEQDDLWRELTAVSQQYGGLTRNVTVKEIMDTWTTQTGYPILTVTRDYEDKTLTITQKRYFSLSTKSVTRTSWWVPLSVACERDVVSQLPPLQWLAKHEGVAQPHKFGHGAEPNEWVLFNYDMIAPYRVNYDKRNWHLLTEALRMGDHNTVPVMGRVQLISDAFALAWTNHIDYSTALGLASYLARERDYLPLSTGLKALAKIENVLKRSPDYGAFQKFVRKLIGETYEKAGGLATMRIINGQDLNSVKMQVTTSAWACRMKVPGCEENAMQLFQQWMDTPNPDEHNPIPLDLHRTVYCVAVSRGSVLHWRFALAREQRANVASVREALLQALTCTKEVWILAQYLEWTVSDGPEVRRQDAGAVIASILRSTVGYYVAKDFVYERIGDIHNAFKGQGRRVGYIIKTLLEQFTSQRELDDFLVWREKNNKYLQDSKLSVEQAIEKAKVNIDWISKNKKAVVDKLRDFSTIIAEDDVSYKAQDNRAWDGSRHGRVLILTVLASLCLSYVL